MITKVRNPFPVHLPDLIALGIPFHLSQPAETAQPIANYGFVSTACHIASQQQALKEEIPWLVS
jgi:hypothetical protein